MNLMRENKSAKSGGFTLVELVVGAAVFVVVATAVYGAYSSLFKFMNKSQYLELAIDLATEQIEIIRNMPYSDVGVTGSIPNGNVPYEQTIVRGGVPFKVTAIIRNIDLPFDGTAGGTPNDTNPADNRLISITVSCPSCADPTPLTLTGQVAPNSLESTGNTGSIFIHVYDAVGKPIQGANVTTTYYGTTTLVINDITDSSGLLALVGVPPGTNAYNIKATKSGYSTDQTYPLGGVGNPNPTNFDPNVVTGQVTEVDLFIDKLTSLTVSSVLPTCSVVSNFDLNITGSKEKGPGVPKYSEDVSTGGSGTLNIPSIEWDTAYRITPLDTSYDLAGVNPANPVALNPDGNVDLQLVVVPKDSNSLMITVTDVSTGLPMSGATVHLHGGSYDSTKVTGQGFISQTDWSAGGGQDLYANQNQFWTQDSNLDVTTVPGDILLRNSFGEYNLSGYLESSTFDTGTTSNFYNFIWLPSSEPASTSVRFQFATSPSSTPPTGWIYSGPDGTGATYYTVTNSSFNSILNNNQYARYRAYLETATSTATPTVSDIGFTYTSACIPPGQVLFQGLSEGSYTLDIAKTGYVSVNDTISVSSGWQEQVRALTQ